MTLRPLPVRVLVGIALFLIAFMARPAPAQTFTWDNANGSWSTETNWVGGIAPPPGGGVSVELVFLSRAQFGIFTTNDLGDPFSVNRLTFSATRFAFGNTIFLDSAPGNTIEMVANGGTGPSIRQQGPGGVFLNSGLTLAAQTEVLGTASGGITFAGVLTGSGGLAINTAPLSTSSGLVFLNNTNTFSGGVTLEAGNLAVGNDDALGTGTLTVNGGTLRPTPSFTLQVTLPNAVTANAALTVTGLTQLTLNGPVSGPGGINYVGTSTLTLTASNGYAGATSVGFGPLPPGEYGGGTLVLSGANGSAAASSGFLVGPGATLTLDNSVDNNSNRIGDAAGVVVSGGLLNIFGHPTLLTDESIGTLTAAGSARVTLFAGSAGARLTTPALVRTDRGTFAFDGPNLGGPLASGSSQVVVSGGVPDLIGGGGAAGTTTISILPYATGRSPFGFNATGLVTYEAGTGIRPLAFGEYAGSIASGTTSADNVLLFGTSTVIGSATTVNALLLGGGGSFTTLDGPGPLTVTSGAVNSEGFSTIHTALSFGTQEAVFHIGEVFGGSLTVNGTIDGTGGLTKAGFGTLTLLGTNTYTGTTTITAGAVAFASDAAFGTDPSAIVVAGGKHQLFSLNTGLTYVGTSPGALTRDLTVTAGTASILSQGDLNRQPPLLLSGTIDGAGGLSFVNPFAGGPLDPTYVLTGANSYTGPTHVQQGVTLIVPSDAALGDGGALDLAGKLSLAGNWTTARPIVLGGQSGSDSTLATNGFDATWDGTVSSASQFLTFYKTGAGRLTLTAESPFTGAIDLAAGELWLGGQGAIQLDSVTVEVGGRLVLDNTGTNLTNRLTPATTINLFGGELRLLGAGGSASTGDLVGMVAAGNGLGIVTVTPGGASARADLVMSGLAVGIGQAYLFRGDGLGATPGDGVGSLFFSGFVPLTGGGGEAGSTTVSIFQAALGDQSSSGAGSGFVTYDPATGIRLLTIDEYATTITSGDFTLNNVRLAEGVSIDATTRINALHLEAGGGLTLNDTLVLASGNLFASGGTNAIAGTGRLRFIEDFATAGPGVIGVAGGSTLTVTAPVEAAGSLTKLGAGTLVLDGPLGVATTTLTVGTGTLRVGTAPDLARATLTVLGGATFDLDGNSKVVNGLQGTGDVTLGAGTLTVGRPGLLTGDELPPAATSFAGNIAGTGGLSVRAAFSQTNAFTLTGATAFTGLTAVGANSTLTLTAAGAVGSSSGVAVDGTLVWDNQIANVANRLGTGPIALTGGSLRVTGNYLADSALTTGELRIGRGTGQVSLASGPGVTLGLTAASLARDPGGVVLLSGDQLGEASGTGRSNLFFAAAPTGLLVGGGGSAGTPQVSILPFALTAFADGTHAFTTYEAARGARPLTADEVTPLVVGLVTQDDNAWVVAPTTITAPTAVNSLILGLDIDGSSPLTVRSGAILVPSTSGSTTVTAPVAFDGAEGIVHVHGFDLNLAGPVSGSAGLTKAGPGILFLNGVNTYSGPTFVADGALVISDSVLNGVAGPLGQSSSPVTLAGGTDPFLYLSAEELDFERPLVVGAGGSGGAYLVGALDPSSFLRIGSSLFSGDVALDGYLTVRATRSDITRTGFTFGGTISGGGGLVFDTGTIALGGANTFSGGSLILDTGFLTRPIIGIGSNTALGTGPLVVNGSGTLRADGGARTLANAIFFRDTFTTVLSTSGPNDLTLTGPVVLGTSFSFIETAVTGTGVLTFAGPVAGPFGTTWTVSGGSARLTADSPFQGNLIVRAEELRLSGAGALPAAGGINIGLGARLELDNSAANVVRLPAGAFVAPSGGEIAIRGAAGELTAESVFVLAPDINTSGVLTLEPGAGGSVTFSTVFIGTNATSLLIRGTNLGATPGPGVANVFDASPNLVGGFGDLGTSSVSIYQGILGDTSATGTGAGFVTYDPAVGVRLLTAAEYDAVLPAAPGGTLVNVRLSGAHAGPAGPTDANSLTLAAGAALTLSDTLHLNSGSLFAEGAGSAITGGTLAFSIFPGFSQLGVIGVAQGGDLTITSTLNDIFGLHKLGGGLLTLNGTIPDNIGDVAVAAGTLRLGAAAQLDNSFVTIHREAAFDLGNNDKTLRGIAGPGTVQLGTGTLTLTQQGSIGPFTGAIEGTGGVSLVGSIFGGTTLELEKPSGYTGTTTIDPFSVFRLYRAGTAASGSYQVAGVLELDDTQGTVANRLAVTAGVSLNNGTLLLRGGDFTHSTHTIGTLTAAAGEAKVQLTPDLDHAVTLTAGILVRNPGTTVTFVSETLGGPVGPNASRVIFTAPPALVGGDGAPGTTSISILPYAIRSAFGTTDLVTHDANGVRALAETEYESTIPAGVTAANVRLDGSALVSTPTTINALVLPFTSISGDGPLTVASGAIAVYPFSGSFISTPLEFGAREGVIHLPGFSTLTIDQPVSGSGGLTVGSTGTLFLDAANAITGPIRVGPGRLHVNGSLPAAAPVFVAAGGRLSGTGTVTDAVSIAADGIIAPGNSAGTLTTGPLTIAPGGTYEWEIETAGAGNVPFNSGGSTTGGGVHDGLVVNGNLVLDGAVIRVVPTTFTGFDPAQSYSWRLAAATGTISTTGAIVDTSFFYVPTDFETFALGVDGNVLYLNFTPIPEPGLVLFAAAAGLLGAGAIRRKRRLG